MVATIVATVLSTSATPISAVTPFERRLARLSKLRQEFDDRVVEDRRYVGEETIYSMPCDQHIIGFYPAGAGDHRYLLYTMGRPYHLYYQQVRHGRAKTLWRLVLDETSEPPRFSGTLGGILNAWGVEVHGRVTNSQRASLNDVKAFAGYERDPWDNAYSGWLVRPDGTMTRRHQYQESKIVPIVDDEAAILGLGKHSWPPNLPYEVRK